MSGPRPRVELFLRSLAPTTGREQQDRTVQRLRTLEEEDVVRNVEVVLCGDCVCPRAATAETDPGEHLLNRYEAFETWAAECGRDLIGFEKRDTRSVLTGATVTGIVFPRVVLAEYREGDLAFVAPSEGESAKTRVRDRLSAYEAGTAIDRGLDEAQREPGTEDATVDEVEE